MILRTCSCCDRWSCLRCNVALRALASFLAELAAELSVAEEPSAAAVLVAELSAAAFSACFSDSSRPWRCDSISVSMAVTCSVS